MLRYAAPVLALLVLSACGQQAAPDGEPAARMPAMTFEVTETDADGKVVMEATVEFETDGDWEREGTDPGVGSLTDSQVERLTELASAEDFPDGDGESGKACITRVPPYQWRLQVGDEAVSNGNGGCVDSESAADIADLVQEAAEVGPTLEENR